MTDLIYSELTYSGNILPAISSLPGMKERTVFLHGFSKAFAMTGFRVGYACGPFEIIDAMMKIHQYSMLCAPITPRKPPKRRSATANVTWRRCAANT